MYALAKGNQQKDKSDKTRWDYEYEKSKDELTFKPQIFTKSHNHTGSSSYGQSNSAVKKQGAEGQSHSLQLSNDKYAQKQKERMEKAREEKERIRLLLERGTTHVSGAVVHAAPQFTGSEASAGKPKQATVVSRRSPKHHGVIPMRGGFDEGSLEN